jgi:hypothetical protein
VAGLIRKFELNALHRHVADDVGASISECLDRDLDALRPRTQFKHSIYGTQNYQVSERVVPILAMVLGSANFWNEYFFALKVIEHPGLGKARQS